MDPTRPPPEQREASVAELVSNLPADIEKDGAVFGWNADEAVTAVVAHGKEAVDELIPALSRSSFAHISLSLIGGDKAVNALLGELETWNWRRQQAAANALGRIGDPRALPSLREHASASSAEVSQAVNAAICKIQRKHGIKEESLPVDPIRRGAVPKPGPKKE